jgi:D-alanine-D-alanine ligase
VTQKIAVLMGGRSLEREISLQSGSRVVSALESRGYRVLALDLVPGLVDTLRSEKPDAVYVTLHGKFGEDGMIQELLEFLKIPYTGPGVLASMLAWDKDLAKRLFLTSDIPTPPWVAFSAEAIKEMGAASALDLVGDEIGGYPVAVKPAEQGSALGLSRVENAKELAEAMLAALGYDSKVLVERWIAGTEIAIPILDGPDGPEVLPAVEIVPKQGLYDYESMYTVGETEYFVPARLPDDVLVRASQLAESVYNLLGCRDVSRIDMVVAEDGTPYVLECSSSPGLTETSVLAMSAQSAGLSFELLVERIVQAALARRHS